MNASVETSVDLMKKPPRKCNLAIDHSFIVFDALKRPTEEGWVDTATTSCRSKVKYMHACTCTHRLV